MSKHKPTDPEPGGGASRTARERLRAQQELRSRRRREQRTMMIIAGVLVLALVGGGIGLQVWRTHRHPSAVAGVDTAAALNHRLVPENRKPLVLGNADAPVTVTLYEDFHCPHCVEFEKQFGPTLTSAQMAGTARIELYPMAFIDEGSTRAANGLACAAEAGFPQTYYLGLFDNHTLEWNSSQLITLASRIGAEPSAEFSTCVTNNRHSDWVDSIRTAAAINGVDGTPTMLINNTLVEISTLTVDGLKQLIDQAGQQ